MSDAPLADQPVVLRHLEDGVLTLTMNRPERVNALNRALMSALYEAVADAAEDARVGCVVLNGAGKGFCSGGDVTGGGKKREKTPEELAIEAEKAARRGPPGFESSYDSLRLHMDTSRLLHEMPKPTIASIHGGVAGAGFSLALATDFRILADNAKFNTSFVNIGLSGDYGGTWFATQLVGGMKAKELYLLSEKIDAQEAFRIGLANRVVPLDQLQAETLKMARKLADGPRVALRYMKRAINAAEAGGSLSQNLDIEAMHQTRCTQTEDHREAARAFVERRPPVFQGK